MSHVNGSGAPAPIVELPAPDLPAPIVIETPPLPAWLCEVSAQPVSLAECLACSRRRAQVRCPFVPSILKALANSRGGDEGLETLKGVSRATGWPILRATSLVGCPRKAWYERHEGRPLEKPSDHWARLRGVIFHAAMQRVAGADAMSESRLSTVVTAGKAKAIVRESDQPGAHRGREEADEGIRRTGAG